MNIESSVNSLLRFMFNRTHVEGVQITLFLAGKALIVN